MLYPATLGAEKLAHKAILAAHDGGACRLILWTPWAMFRRVITMAFVTQKFIKIFLVQWHPLVQRFVLENIICKFHKLKN